MSRLGTFVSVQAAIFTLTVVFVAVLVRPVAAQSETPSEFIAMLGDNAIQALVEEDLTADERIENFRAILTEGFDLPLIGRFALGIYWRRATEEQKSEYIELFQNFLVQAYASRLGQYGGQT